MKQTSTVIAWPSKLKIGAKSKKGYCRVQFSVHFLLVCVFKLMILTNSVMCNTVSVLWHIVCSENRASPVSAIQHVFAV